METWPICHHSGLHFGRRLNIMNLRRNSHRQGGGMDGSLALLGLWGMNSLFIFGQARVERDGKRGGN